MPLKLKNFSCSSKMIPKSGGVGKFPEVSRKVVKATIWGGYGVMIVLTGDDPISNQHIAG